MEKKLKQFRSYRCSIMSPIQYLIEVELSPMYHVALKSYRLEHHRHNNDIECYSSLHLKQIAYYACITR